jgi:hypothetical protein
MFAFTQPRFWALFFTTFRCHRCGSYEGYTSRPRNFVETYILGLFSLRPARCADCYRRSWRPARVPLMSRRDNLQFDVPEMLSSARVSERKETKKETHALPDERQRIA